MVGDAPCCEGDCNTFKLNLPGVLEFAIDGVHVRARRVRASVPAFHPGAAAMANPLLAPLFRFFGKLSYPRLFALAAALFAIDVVIPDFVPFADELLLGLGTLLLANWKKRKDPAAPEKAAIDGEARRR